MEVSTFELLLKSLPRNDSTEGHCQIVQGYSLTVANREPIDLTFQVEFLVSPTLNLAQGDAPRLKLKVDASKNHNVTLFTGQILGDNYRYVGLVRIPANQTVLLQLLPVDVEVEIRGYVLLRLPQLPFSRSPQSETPVKVLLKPATRRILQQDQGETEFEINCPLAVASDKALNLIEPDQGRFIDPVGTVTPFVTNESLLDYLLRQIENFELTDSDVLALAGEQYDQVMELVELSQSGFDDEVVSELCGELNIPLEQSVF